MSKFNKPVWFPVEYQTENSYAEYYKNPRENRPTHISLIST